MKFSIDTGAIQRIIKMLGVVTKANAVDSTGRILIESSGSNIEFSANNGVLAITLASDEVDIMEPGTISIVYNKIKSFSMSFKPWDGNSGSKVFTFDSDEKNTLIIVDNISENGRKSKGRLKLGNFNPALATPPIRFGEANFSLNSTIFRTCTNKVLYAINPTMDFTSGALQGMNMKFDEENIYFAGSDGRVLSEYQVKNVSDKIDGNIVFNYDFMMGLRRLINDDIQMLFEIKGNRISIKFNDVVFSGRLIIGHEYPDYRASFDNYNEYINLSKDFFISSLSPFVDILDPEDNFRLTLEIKNKNFKLYNDQAIMEAEQDIQAGIDFSIDINGKLLLQTVDAIKDDYVLFKFSDPNSLLVFDSSTYNDQKALITPLRKR